MMRRWVRGIEIELATFRFILTSSQKLSGYLYTKLGLVTQSRRLKSRLKHICKQRLVDLNNVQFNSSIVLATVVR
jgi:hypothetical protein